MAYLIVFLGGGLGAAMRHGVNIASARAFGTGFPYGTLLINITGSLLMGLVAAYFAFKGDASQHWRLFLTTGILGGYTTFSAFSLDAALLYERGEVSAAVFDKYRIETYKEAGWKPYVIAAMIMARRFADPAQVLAQVLADGRPRVRQAAAAGK